MKVPETARHHAPHSLLPQKVLPFKKWRHRDSLSLKLQHQRDNIFIMSAVMKAVLIVHPLRWSKNQRRRLA